MSKTEARRDFLGAMGAGALVGLGDLGFLGSLRPVSADEIHSTPAKVQLSEEIEPLVRLIEDSPREKLLEAAAARIRQGVEYPQLLAAVMLAGVRGIKPRPVGFKFHAVLVVHSAHLASLAAVDRDRWLPLFWALDNFKSSQERNKQEGGWVMPPVEEAKLPSAAQAKSRFVEAMDGWDEAGADRAVAALVRNAGASEVIETFWRYGARDFRDIGHKAIYTANAWRTLQTIGWRHAEPIMRSLAFALLEHEGDNPARRDADADRPWRENLHRAAKIRPDWRQGKIETNATSELLSGMREAAPGEACDQVVAALNRGIDPCCVWDALFLLAGELLMRQPGIVGIHCVTSANALHYGFQTSGVEETRKMLLLQAAAFLAMFRITMRARGNFRDELKLDALEHAELKSAGPEAVAEIFANVGVDRVVSARKTLALLDGKTIAAESLIAAGRRLVFLKGRDSHDYKFCSAAMEDYYHVSPAWRNRYLAASMFNLHGSGDPDNELVQRTRAALG